MDATAWAAIATAASAAVVGWQAWETRRTAAAAEDALTVSRQDLAAAQQSLTLARQTLDTTRAQSVDAMRARLDARAAVLRVEVEPVATLTAFAPSVGNFGDPQPWPFGHQFRMDKDANEMIILRAAVRIRNAGNDPVVVDLGGALRPAGTKAPTSPFGSSLVIEARTDQEAVLEEARPLTAWIQNFRDREAGRDASTVIVGYVRHSDPWDNGIIDSWTLELSGIPIRPVDRDLAAWSLNHWMDGGTANVWVAVRPADRRYYTSKAKNTLLAEHDRDESG